MRTPHLQELAGDNHVLQPAPQHCLATCETLPFLLLLSPQHLEAFANIEHGCRKAVSTFDAESEMLFAFTLPDGQWDTAVPVVKPSFRILHERLVQLHEQTACVESQRQHLRVSAERVTRR